MPTSLWFVVKSHRFKGCQSTMMKPPLNPREVPVVEAVWALNDQVRHHQRVAGPTQLIATDRLGEDARLLGHKPSLVDSTWDCVPLDLEVVDPERVEYVRARDVQDHGAAPATADAWRARAVDLRNPEFADEFPGVRIDESPAPLEPDHVHVESIRVVRRVLEICVERECVEGQSEEQGDQQSGQNRGQGGIPSVGHNADAGGVLGILGTGL